MFVVLLSLYDTALCTKSNLTLQAIMSSVCRETYILVLPLLLQQQHTLKRQGWLLSLVNACSSSKGLHSCFTPVLHEWKNSEKGEDEWSLLSRRERAVRQQRWCHRGRWLHSRLSATFGLCSSAVQSHMHSPWVQSSVRGCCTHFIWAYSCTWTNHC